MSNNITYLFGAGASAKAVPVVSEFNVALKDFLLLLEKNKEEFIAKKQDKRVCVDYQLIIDNVVQLIEESHRFGTIDTYARKLVLSNSTSILDKLKITLSIFFKFWQEYDFRNKETNRVEKKTILAGNKEFLDKRYVALFSNLLIRNDDKIKIPDNINILTWNYDWQISMALKLFVGNLNLSEVHNYFGIYPNINETFNVNNPKVIHLNGMAGVFELTSNSKPMNIHDWKASDNSFISFMSQFDSLYTNYNRSEFKPSTAINFAWENTPVSIEARRAAIQIMKKTDILIVIGYSFPGFNLEIDRLLFKEYLGNKQNNNKYIFYQDRSANKELIRDSFGFDQRRIFTRDDIEQFLIPRQYL